MVFERDKLRWFSWWSIVLIVVFLLKYHYSVATAFQLQWILQPLAWLTQLVSGLPFIMNDTGEWLNAQNNIAIVKSCAGVNFMLLSFLVSTWRLRPINDQGNLLASCLYFILLSLIIAWGMTLLINTLRIFITIQLYLHEIGFPGLTSGQIHRLAGVFIFLPALWMQLNVSSKLKTSQAGIVAGTLYLSLVIIVPFVTGNYKYNLHMFTEQVYFIVGSTVIIYSISLLVKIANSVVVNKFEN
jgi:exosortase K